MTKQPVLLGVPISMALRGLETVRAVAGGKALTGAALGGLLATAPWLTAMVNSSASGEISSLDIVDAVMPLAMGALAFIDMQAKMVGITQKRRISVHSIPSRRGDWIQDLGSHSARYHITGSFYDTDPHYLSTRGMMQTIMQTFIGSAAVGNIHLLNLVRESGASIPIVTKHEITFGMISDFTYTEMGGEPMEVKYDIKLIEVGGIPLIGKTVLFSVRNTASNIASVIA